MGLFSMLTEDDKAAQIPIPELPELKRADLMLMEKETTGIYLSGHPMDDYRHYLKNTSVVPIGTVTEEENNYRDDQIVTVAGITQSIKMKTTKNNSVMAYVTLEDNTGAIEMLVFSKVLGQYGGNIRENEPVVITGRLSLREDKDPQIVVNSAAPIDQYANRKSEQVVALSQQPEQLTLYLRLPGESGPLFPKVRAILNMFPGRNKTIVYFADTQRRRGTQCGLAPAMIAELRSLLGEENVVIK